MMALSIILKDCSSIFKVCFFYFVFVNSFSLFLPHGTKAFDSSDDNERVVNIGAIVDFNSRVGKEEKTAMDIAVRNFNTRSRNLNLALHFQDHQRLPLEAAQAAERLIKEKEVKAIVGFESWEVAALVADIGSQAQVPVISFSSPAITPPLTQSRWPFLVRMVYNNSEQMKCIAELTRFHNWRRVVTVHEDHAYGGDSGELTLFSQALQKAGSEIEYSLVLPPFHLLNDPEEFVKQELAKLEKVKSRVFIILQTSMPLVIDLFRVAKEMGMVGEDSVWILTDTVTSYLDSVDTSVIQSIEGALGIKTYYSDTSYAYKSFRNQFRKVFRSEYPEEDNFEPGFYALQAYDSITTIIKSMGSNISNPKVLLHDILSSNFSGLSGQIQFQAAELVHDPILRIVNVVGRSYKEIDFWLPELGFSKSMNRDENRRKSIKLQGPVNWPGDLKRNPKGWAMPSDANPMIIGVPGRTSFEKFVKVVNKSENIYDGYCIEVFHKAIALLGYNLTYKFEPFDGLYEDLVNHLYDKKYDAVVGDITILAERSERLEFTQPYAESGLSMIVPAKSEESAWMFMKPFTWQMWAGTGVILVYTMFIVWFLEHQNNPEFRGPWKSQMGTAVLFTFSSLFFAHRERIYSNLTRLVIAVWLFVVLVLNSSYTASLTSMLTIQRLQPNVTDIEWLKQNNMPVGCDGDSFVKDYLEHVLKFKPENIKSIGSEYNYSGEFQSKKIYAAFLELPYQKVFIDHYCKKYVATAPTYRFGGLGFAFQKGSPLAADVSKAILKISENGDLKKLEDKWFTSSSECNAGANDITNESLSLKSFCGLYLISGATSTICFILFLIHLLKKYRNYQKEALGNATPSEKGSSIWNKTISVARYIYHGEPPIPGRSPGFSPSPDGHQWFSQSWESASPAIPASLSASTPAEIEIIHIPENPQDSHHHVPAESDV